MPQNNQEAERAFYATLFDVYETTHLIPLQTTCDGRGGKQDEFNTVADAEIVAAAFIARGIAIQRHDRFIDYSLPQ